MESRLIIAYALIALIALFSTGFVAYRVYFSRDRTYRRRLRREQQVYDARHR